MKSLHEKNFSFKPNPSKKSANLKNRNKIKIFNSTDMKFINNKDLIKKQKNIKLLDTIIVVINIISNVLFVFFIGDTLNGFYYATGLGYDFTTTRIIGIIIFAIAQLTGIYLTIKFFLKQNLKIRLLLVSAPLTFLLFGGLWLLYNINNINITDDISASELLGITSEQMYNIDFKYIIIALAIYIVLVYLLYGYIFKQSKATKIANSK